MSKKPTYDEKIGQRLVRFNVLDSYHVKNVLIRQKHGDKRLFGEIAVDLGYLREKTLDSYMKTKGLDLYDTKNSKDFSSGSTHNLKVKHQRYENEEFQDLEQQKKAE